jgi:hypothetical protein
MTPPPVTLTKAQYLATPVGGQAQNYAGYLRYIARARGGVVQQPLPDGKMQASDAPFVNGTGAGSDPYAGIIGSLPRPMTNQQITTQAHGEISPLVAAVTKQIEGQTQAATNAIKGFSGDAAAKLAALDFGAPYQGAEQGQAAVDAALQQSLSGAGTSDANALASRLAAINDPTVAAAANTLQANGAANGNTQLAQGSAALSNLIANAAAAKDYGLKQPGIQQLAGLQDIAAAEQAGTANIGTQTQQLEQQLPSIIQSLASQNDNRAAALTAARENQIARNDAINATAANNATKLAETKATAAAGVTKAEIAAQTKATAAEVAAARSDRSYRLQFAKTFGYDPITNKTLPGYTRNAAGEVVKAGSPSATGMKPPTADEINTWVDAFKNGKPTSVTRPVIDPKTGQVKTNPTTGKPVTTTQTQALGRLNYGQAYARLTALHVPDQEARQALDTVYKRGEQGRSWLSNEEQHALSSAKLPPVAHRYNGHAYLDQTQAQALTAANRMPPGQWVQGHTNTQDLGPIYVIASTY